MSQYFVGVSAVLFSVGGMAFLLGQLIREMGAQKDNVRLHEELEMAKAAEAVLRMVLKGVDPDGSQRAAFVADYNSYNPKGCA